jgi:hypothetical protein
MGIYIYTVRRTGVANVEIDGEVRTVHPLKYLFNCYFDMGDLCKEQRMQLGSADRVWQDKEPPKYVVIVGDEGAREGDPVYEWNSEVPWWYDCDSPGKFVGYLVKKSWGRRKKDRIFKVRQHYVSFVDEKKFDGSRTLDNQTKQWRPTYPGIGWTVFGGDSFRPTLCVSEGAARDLVEEFHQPA